MCHPSAPCFHDGRRKRAAKQCLCRPGWSCREEAVGCDCMHDDVGRGSERTKAGCVHGTTRQTGYAVVGARRQYSATPSCSCTRSPVVNIAIIGPQLQRDLAKGLRINVEINVEKSVQRLNRLYLSACMAALEAYIKQLWSCSTMNHPVQIVREALEAPVVGTAVATKACISRRRDSGRSVLR